MSSSRLEIAGSPRSVSAVKKRKQKKQPLVPGSRNSRSQGWRSTRLERHMMFRVRLRFLPSSPGGSRAAFRSSDVLRQPHSARSCFLLRPGCFCSAGIPRPRTAHSGQPSATPSRPFHPSSPPWRPSREAVPPPGGAHRGLQDGAESGPLDRACRFFGHRLS